MVINNQKRFSCRSPIFTFSSHIQYMYNVHPLYPHPLSTQYTTHNNHREQIRLQIAIRYCLTLFQFKSISFTFAHFPNIQQTFAFIVYICRHLQSVYIPCSPMTNIQFGFFCVSIFGCVLYSFCSFASFIICFVLFFACLFLLWRLCIWDM